MIYGDSSIFIETKKKKENGILITFQIIEFLKDLQKHIITQMMCVLGDWAE